MSTKTELVKLESTSQKKVDVKYYLLSDLTTNWHADFFKICVKEFLQNSRH